MESLYITHVCKIQSQQIILNDKVVFEGRFNMGAVSLHLPMILAKARQESKDFYEVLDYYMELIRGLHKRTID